MGKKILTGYGWYRFERTYFTNISRDYLDGEAAWDEYAALRECIQNAMDEAQFMAEQNGGQLLDYISLSADSDWIRLHDKGRGVDWQHIFLLGRSDKRGSQYRGEKGEGQLMSFLVFAKLGIQLRMFSQDWMAEARFDTYEGGSNEVLVLDLYRAMDTSNPKSLECGTSWRTQRTDALAYVVANIGQYFPELDRRGQRRERTEQRKRDAAYWKAVERGEKREARKVKSKSTSMTKTVFEPRNGNTPRLYLRGIYVRDLDAGLSSLFSYNLKDADINRDRSMVDQSRLVDEVSKALGSEDVTRKMMRKYWEHAVANDFKSGYLEYRTIPYDISNGDGWAKAFYSQFGKKTCLFTNTFVAADCLNEDWNVVQLNPMSQKFAERLGIKTDRQVSGFGDADFKVVKPTAREAKIIGLAAAICDRIAQEVGEVEVVSKIIGEEKTEGFAKNGKVYILRSVFEQGGLAVLRVLLHEAGHNATGYGDFTRAFTEWFLCGWINSLRNDVSWYETIGAMLRKLEVL